MTNSYLGIITPRGLEALVLETDHDALFLNRRVERQFQGDAILCWAVLDARTARNVIGHIGFRRFGEALDQLNRRAIHLGTLLPSWADDDQWRSAS